MINREDYHKMDTGDISNRWYVYMICCCDGTYYTGITKDIIRRIAEHNSDQGGSKYTRSRKPVKLAYVEHAKCRSTASKREYHLKLMNRTQKIALIESNPNLDLRDSMGSSIYLSKSRPQE